MNNIRANCSTSQREIVCGLLPRMNEEVVGLPVVLVGRVSSISSVLRLSGGGIRIRLKRLPE